jgi:hypothetical protein
MEPVYCPNHCLNEGDYIIISGALGTASANGIPINGQVFQVGLTVTNGFTTNPAITTGTYLGLGVITRMYIPLIQSKQFPVAWGEGRKVRLGAQQYLLTKTTNAQVTLLIYLSQDADTAWNNSPIVPAQEVTNSSLVYSTVLYSCPESINLCLTPFNTNLQQLNTFDPNNVTNTQAQIWHRMNTSLLGDTVQVGITLSPTQMTTLDSNGNPVSQFAEIELHGMILDVSPSGMLS